MKIFKKKSNKKRSFKKGKSKRASKSKRYTNYLLGNRGGIRL